jgi:Ca-activated chloride channel family protein
MIAAASLALAAALAQNFHVDVDFVQVECSASKDGRSVLDMKLDDFDLLDNGKPRPIERLWVEKDLPLIIGLIADVSGSQAQFIPGHRQTFVHFLRQILRPQDRAFIVTLAHDVRLVADLTSSSDELQRGLDTLGVFPPEGVLLAESPPRCSTALWNGVYFTALLRMKALQGRKAFVVLTDGFDRGSTHSLSDAIEAAQAADTRVYTIRYSIFPTFTPTGALITSLGPGAKLHRLAAETGGLSFRAPGSGDASAIFSQIEEELRTMYVLGFHVPEASRDGKAHRLEVRSKRRGVTLRAKKRYVAA